MKNLTETLNEALNINESKEPTMDDIEKLDKSMSDSKLKAFIKKHESEITSEKLGSSDIKDIAFIMSEIHANISSKIDFDEAEDIPDFLDDVYGVIGDEIDSEDWVDTATDLYKTLFKEVTHKDLV